MIPKLRGDVSDERCWFILFNTEFVLSTTTIGLIPILIVFILYGIILQKALKKVGELKKATSVIATNGSEGNGNNLRFFRGSIVDLNQSTVDREHDIAATVGKQSSESVISRCCWCFSSSNTFSPENISMTVTARRQPSRWKAIKIVMLTTGSFVVTWVSMNN